MLLQYITYNSYLSCQTAALLWFWFDFTPSLLSFLRLQFDFLFNMVFSTSCDHPRVPHLPTTSEDWSTSPKPQFPSDQQIPKMLSFSLSPEYVANVNICHRERGLWVQSSHLNAQYCAPFEHVNEDSGTTVPAPHCWCCPCCW